MNKTPNVEINSARKVVFFFPVPYWIIQLFLKFNRLLLSAQFHRIKLEFPKAHLHSFGNGYRRSKSRRRISSRGFYTTSPTCASHICGWIFKNTFHSFYRTYHLLVIFVYNDDLAYNFIFDTRRHSFVPNVTLRFHSS